MATNRQQLRFVELGRLSLRQWVELTEHAPAPFGATTAALTFRPKDRHIAALDAGGRLIAAVGATIVALQVGGDVFDVVGVGALIVQQAARGRGLAIALLDALRGVTDNMGPARAMLFCEPHLAALYERRGYFPIHSPVFADQPHGRIEVPLEAMWRPIRPSTWPDGTVEIDGQPF